METLTKQHYTMISLGSVSGTMPGGQRARKALNYAFDGNTDELRTNPERHTSINHMMHRNAQRYAQQLRAQGADDIQIDLRELAHVL